mgnify:CR=1 FL=1
MTTAEPDIDLTGEHGQVIAGGVMVPWEPRPIMIAAFKGDKLTVVDLRLRPSRVRVGSCDPTTTSCRCRFYDTIEKGAAEVACRDSRVIEHKGSTLRIRSTSRGLSLIATVNEVANVVTLWKIRIDGERLSISQPVDFWHN